jgi:hypothetical protein
MSESHCARKYTDIGDERPDQHDPLGNCIDEYLQSRLGRADRIYSHAINSLWIGNGGAAVATLSFIASISRQGQQVTDLFVPLGIFVLGLICMGTGSLSALLGEIRSIKRLEKGTLSLDDIQSDSVQAGLTLRNWQMRMALIAGFLFVVGCLAGFAALWLVVH